MSKQKTWTAKAADLKSDWYVVDATDQVLGRLASGVAKVLRGKHKPTFTPHLNTGDHVVVINASKIKVTGAKLGDKMYSRYSGYPGGLRQRSFQKQQELDPTFPLMAAVRGMLQRNTLGADMLTRLRVYAGAEHGHQVRSRRSCPSTPREISRLAEVFNRGTGRRKNAVARVRIQPGEGRVVINDKDTLAYLGRRVLEMAALAPLRITSTQRKFDVSVKVFGGGTSGQAGAISHGIARALIKYDPDFRPALKKAGLLTRDARMKERKKYGLKRARKAPQYTKR
jgi:small subunit ribosomal protein S9